MFKAKDFMIGWELGKDAQEQRKQNRLREGLKQLDEQQVEEIKTPQAADPNTEQSKMLAAQNEGLTNELPPTPVVTGYKYGDQTFQYKPPAEYVDALKADRRAALFEQHGDIDKAQVLREAAVKQRATAIQGIMDRAVRSGRLEDMFAGYSLIDDGYDASFERGKDGSITAYWWDQTNPDKRSVAFTAANDQEARQRIMDMMDPELSSKLADAESLREWRKSQAENQQFARKDRATMAQDRVRMQEQQQLLRQIQILDYRAKQALATGQEDVFINASQQRDALEAQLSGLSSGGGVGGASGEGNYSGIIRSLNRTESNGPEDWGAVGPVTRSGERAIGRLQFMPDRLQEAQRALGLQFTPEQFKASPELQQQVEQWHFGDLDKQIKQRGLDRYIGQTRGGQKITLDGLRAGAHLGGIGGLTKFLETDGGTNYNDRRTAISDYVGFHAGDGASQGLTAGPTTSGIDYKKMFQAGRQTATAMRPGTSLSQAQIDKIRQEEENAVMLDPAVANLSPDAQQQIIESRIANRLAGATGATPANPVGTPEQRMERFRSILGLPAPQVN